jgi:hypothetical protein
VEDDDGEWEKSLLNTGMGQNTIAKGNGVQQPRTITNGSKGDIEFWYSVAAAL